MFFKVLKSFVKKMNVFCCEEEDNLIPTVVIRFEASKFSDDAANNIVSVLVGILENAFKIDNIGMRIIVLSCNYDENFSVGVTNEIVMKDYVLGLLEINKHVVEAVAKRKISFVYDGILKS